MDSPPCTCGADLAHDDRCPLSLWIEERLRDPEWVAKMKARSDEADRQMREKGLIT